MKNNVNVKFGNQIKYKNTCHILFEAVETVNSLCLDTCGYCAGFFPSYLVDAPVDGSH